MSLRTREVGIRDGARRASRRGAAAGARPGRAARRSSASASARCSPPVGRVLQSLLYGVSALDPLAYGAAAALLLGVARLANLVPALTAARVDPMRALRSE